MENGNYSLSFENILQNRSVEESSYSKKCSFRMNIDFWTLM